MYDNYDQYYQDQMERFESFEWDLYRQPIADTIDHVFPNSGYKGELLDFCCGDGCTSFYLQQKGFNIQGFDGNIRKIVKAMHRLPGVEFTIHDAKDVWNVKRSFDVIYASHCLEHMLNPLKVLEDLRRLLKVDGMIILILPYPNEESEGHPGSNLLKLNGGLFEVEENLMKLNFDVEIEKINIRESEIIVKLTNR